MFLKVVNVISSHYLSFKGQGTYFNPKLNENGQEYQLPGYTTDILNQKTMEFLEKNNNYPFCALLWHKACHAPFTPSSQT